jgi:hypothetical protein
MDRGLRLRVSHRRLPRWHSRTNAPMSRSASSSSGCHSTPSMKRRVASSSASAVPSPTARAVTRRPVPTRATPWWAAPDGDARAARRQRGEALSLDLDLMVNEAAVRAAVDVVLQPVGEMLLEQPAVGDVHHLHAAADAQARQVALGGRADESQLERVALG